MMRAYVEEFVTKAFVVCILMCTLLKVQYNTTQYAVGIYSRKTR